MCFRLAPLPALLAAAFMLFVSLAQPAVPDDVPKEIAVPPGYKLMFKYDARGVQIYKAVKSGSGMLEWVLEAPLADLFDDKGAKAGLHYEGPSWEASDGSKVVRDKAEIVKSVPAPKLNEDIPWLLIKVKAEEGKDGKFSPAVYIQRLQTQAGKPPAELPKRADSKIGVAYKAVYYFYGKAK
jgi:hypothetical protein